MEEPGNKNLNVVHLPFDALKALGDKSLIEHYYMCYETYGIFNIQNKEI